MIFVARYSIRIRYDDEGKIEMTKIETRLAEIAEQAKIASPGAKIETKISGDRVAVYWEDRGHVVVIRSTGEAWEIVGVTAGEVFRWADVSDDEVTMWTDAAVADAVRGG